MAREKDRLHRPSGTPCLAVAEAVAQLLSSTCMAKVLGAQRLGSIAWVQHAAARSVVSWEKSWGGHGRTEGIDRLGAMSSTIGATGSTALMRLSVYIIGFTSLS